MVSPHRPLGQEFTIDHKGQGLSHPDVVERGLPDIDGQGIEPERRAEDDLTAEPRLQRGHLIAPAGRRGTRSRRRRSGGPRWRDPVSAGGHRLDRDAGRRMEKAVACQRNTVVRDPIDEGVGTVADEVARPGEGIAEARDGRRMHRQRGLVSEEFEEVGRRPVEGDHEGSAHPAPSRRGSPAQPRPGSRRARSSADTTLRHISPPSRGAGSGAGRRRNPPPRPDRRSTSARPRADETCRSGRRPRRSNASPHPG